jgi:hypothetical protein
MLSPRLLNHSPHDFSFTLVQWEKRQKLSYSALGRGSAGTLGMPTDHGFFSNGYFGVRKRDFLEKPLRLFRDIFSF